MPPHSPLRIATRKSALALWQTGHVAAQLRSLHPGIEIELVPLSTRGDEILDRSLATLGGKGLFLKELEVAIEEGRADCAVHSLKDVPMALDAPFALAAVLERADPFDAFVSNRYASLDALPHGARVGTSSLRRQVQVRARRPDLQLVDLRGNVNTRLARLDADEYDAILLACAGLQRLGFDERIRDRLTPPDFLPAVAQGAIAVECRADDAHTRALLVPLDHVATRRCVEAERVMNLRLAGSCQVPIAGFCTEQNGTWTLRALVGDEHGSEILRAEAKADSATLDTLGERVADALLAQGAGRLLAR
ncbi:hydroxymethylbilane synthase [Xanthomonadaceae bacterium XH05]|nr:hydroxymethylbilane synthase [Xanthomonadaceae bacterium XH05]